MKRGDIVNERIRQLRKELKLNQTEFGKRLGIKQTTVAGYETGGRAPIDAVVSLICREFNVNEEWLRTGNGEMFIQMTAVERAYNRFGNIMENASPSKKATLTMLIELIDRLPDDEWDYIMNQYNEALKEAKK